MVELISLVLFPITLGAIAKTGTAPIERVKLIIQTQDANSRIKSGEVKRYTGIVDCFTRVRR